MQLVMLDLIQSHIIGWTCYQKLKPVTIQTQCPMRVIMAHIYCDNVCLVCLPLLSWLYKLARSKVTSLFFLVDRSVIKFNAKAFIDPVGYFEEEESPKAIRRYIKQLFDETHDFQMHKGTSAAMHRNVATVTALTSYLDRIVWASGSAKFKDYTRRFVRRFVGTYNGVLRVFPGAPLPTNFDHVTRPW